MADSCLSEMLKPAQGRRFHLCITPYAEALHPPCSAVLFHIHLKLKLPGSSHGLLIPTCYQDVLLSALLCYTPSKAPHQPASPNPAVAAATQHQAKPCQPTTLTVSLALEPPQISFTQGVQVQGRS
jgi:hypothetical protein